MKSLDISRCALSACAAAMLAGCGGSQPPIGAPGAMPQTQSPVAPTYKVSGALLYVALYYPTAVLVFDAAANNPKPIATITKGIDDATRPCDDSNGMLYVPNDPSNGPGWISEYALGQTKPLRSITKGISTPGGCAIDSSGNLWVTNLGGENVTEYLKDSTKPHLVITKGLTYPTAVAIDRAGNLYVTNPEPFSAPNVQVYAKDQKSPSRTITDGVTYPVGVAVDAHDTLYLVNLFYSCNIEEYRTGQGQPFRTITDGLYGPESIVVGRNGWLYVTDEPDVTGCATSSEPTAILEYPPHSLKPSSREITKDIFGPSGLAYYPPLLP
jgi:hypothetical protein